MKAWWLGLNTREQRLIGALGGVVLIFLFYSLVWQPLNNNIENTEKRVAHQTELLAWVQQETSRYQANSGNVKRPNRNASLSSIVNQAANQSGIFITRIQPQGSDLQIWIDNIAFNVLLQWLEQLSQQHGLIIKNIDLDATDINGEVRVRRLQLGNN
ncbi:type II secretion system protein GspM [Thalassotalea profundi]|uniref:Type II secretion system protein M n=1 Tax=Thalassotalea profundi TaxID=2036687 RepID=A0ABQ3J012_9GAMM|nr:type II secretion system protein M [Thalassotalea profundi]GHE99876.1 type II secretion system protein M [Thalassotalea profundi]